MNASLKLADASHMLHWDWQKQAFLTDSDKTCLIPWHTTQVWIMWWTQNSITHCGFCLRLRSTKNQLAVFWSLIRTGCRCKFLYGVTSSYLYSSSLQSLLHYNNNKIILSFVEGWPCRPKQAWSLEQWPLVFCYAHVNLCWTSVFCGRMVLSPKTSMVIGTVAVGCLLCAC